jgi:hypothetical protein
MGIMHVFNRGKPAVTDVFDTEHGLLGVKYPAVLVTIMGLTGVVAFALTGFLGYPEDTGWVWTAFHQPAVLFLWLCALLYIYQISVYRDRTQRGRLVAMLLATTISIIVIGIGYFNRQALTDFLNYIASVLGLPQLRDLIKLDSPLFWTLLEVLILGIFWIDTVRRWLRRARGLPPYPNNDELPDLPDLISGDLIASGVLTVILALLFTEPVIGTFVQLVEPTGTHVTACTVALPGACRDAIHSPYPPNVATLTFINTILTLFTLSIGLTVLALSAVIAGLGAVEGVEHDPITGPETAGATQSGSAVANIGAGVGSRVLNTLRVALGQRLRLAMVSLVLSMRSVLWPGLVFFSCLSLALGARAVLGYLHHPKTLEFVVSYLLPGAGWFLIAIGAAVMASGLLSVSFRVLWNSLSFLGLTGFVLLLTFWLFSISMWSVAQLLHETKVTDRDPFGLGVTTALSAFALIAYAILAYLPRSRGKPQPAEAAGA